VDRNSRSPAALTSEAPSRQKCSSNEIKKQRAVTYYFSKRLQIPFDAAISRVTDVLKQEGFGILTDIDVQQTLKKKLDIDFRPYRILGACNPPLAYQALQAEDKVGTMLPCNVIVQDVGSRLVEVSAVDPVASMAAIENAKLSELAKTVRAKLRSVIESL
jgi:uncharacterized protein (DUF302 family)